MLDAAGVERRLPTASWQVGDRFVVRPGETVATDGEVVFGHSAVDRSAMTGESLPVDVAPGDAVTGGTVAVGGRLVVRATSVGADTQLAHMVRLVEDAQNEKAAVQRLADRISGVFVPAVLVIAVGTLAGWLLVGGSTEHAVQRGALGSHNRLSVRARAGHAHGPSGRVRVEGARLGIFFKGYQALEASRQVDTVVLDKTGTVTKGRMAVTDVDVVAGVDRSTVLRWAGALEQASEHLVARAITVGRPSTSSVHYRRSRSSWRCPGSVRAGMVEGPDLGGSKARAVRRTVGRPCQLEAAAPDGRRSGSTAVLVGRDDVVVGALALADTVRPTAADAVRELHALGLHCVLLTGDNEATALRRRRFDRCERRRRRCASCGQGRVDPPAPSRGSIGGDGRRRGERRSGAGGADLGLAVGSGTDVAINAADLIVVRDDLRVVATAIGLARRTLRTIRGNLAWAFAYNVGAIPLAACGLLNPLIAGGRHGAFVGLRRLEQRSAAPFLKLQGNETTRAGCHETASQETDC